MTGGTESDSDSDIICIYPPSDVIRFYGLLKSLRLFSELDGDEKIFLWGILKSSSESIERKQTIINKYGEILVRYQNQQGYTPLHYTETEDSARLLVESVGRANREDFICTLNEDKETVLHTSSWWQRRDVVEYITSLNIDMKRLLMVKNLWGKTALHRAGNAEVAHHMVRAAVESECTEEFVCAINGYGKTALHIACYHRKKHTAKYLLSLDSIDVHKLVHIRDTWGCTALHVTIEGEVAKILIGTVRYCDREAYITIRNCDGESALHIACEEGRTDVVEAILGESKEHNCLLFLTDNEGNSPLHKAANRKIVQMLLGAVSDDKLQAFISMMNKKRHTVMHVACAEGRLEVVELLLGYDAANQTLLESDFQGNTPLLLATDCGYCKIVSCILENFENNTEVIRTLLQSRNAAKQNVFHVACRHLSFHSYYEILKEFLHMIDMDEVSKPDLFGNSPLHYVVGTYNVAQFADHVMRLHPATRRQLLLYTYNSTKTNCKSIVKQTAGIDINHVFLHSVLNADASNLYEYYQPKITFDERYEAEFFKSQNVSLHYDHRLFQVMAYALNEYAVRDLGCRAVMSTKQMITDKDKGLLIIDDNFFGDSQERLQTIIESLVEQLEKPDHQEPQDGKPKVILRRKTDKKIKLIPPGPDYILITAEHDMEKPISDERWDPASFPTSDTNALIDILRNRKDIRSVSVNSTFGRHLTTNSQEMFVANQAESAHILNGEEKGHALLICNTKDRDGWQYQHDQVLIILQRHMGMEVKILKDLTAEAMILEVKSLCENSRNSNIVALAILSHGDTRGSIAGTDGKPCSVQEILDCLNNHHLQDCAKVVMLSFCRGEIPAKFNRTPQAFECTDLPDLIESSDYSPVRARLTASERKKRNLKHTFPELIIPVDNYLFFTTLPDSKSSTESIVLEQMNKYLANLSTLANQQISAKVTADSHAVAGSQKIGHVPPHDEQSCDTDSSPPCKRRRMETSPRLQVDLVTLFTDVAGVAREKSQYRVYTNHCYTLNKFSKPVVINLSSANS